MAWLPRSRAALLPLLIACGSDGSSGDEGPPSYCPGVPAWSEPVCRDEADCVDPLHSCVAGPSDCPGPGCASDCEGDGECADWFGPGMHGVCVREGVGCCADAGHCVAPCTADGCGADHSCAADGHCVADACADGFGCAAGTRCEPGVPGADAHGCRAIPCDEAGASACPLVHECVDASCQRITCTSDDGCPCGSCIAGHCWERPWICYEEPA